MTYPGPPPPACGAQPSGYSDSPSQRPRRWWTRWYVVTAAVLVLAVVALTAWGLTMREEPGPVEPVAEGLYRTGDGCLAVEPGEGWAATKEYPKGGSGFSVDENPLDAAPDPGEPGVFVMVSCAPLDKVGGSGPVSIPGTKLLEEETVDLTDGEGKLLTYRYESTDPAMESVQVTIDVRRARCSVRVDGAERAVEAVRDEVDAAIASMRCLGY